MPQPIILKQKCYSYFYSWCSYPKNSLNPAGNFQQYPFVKVCYVNNGQVILSGICFGFCDNKNGLIFLLYSTQTRLIISDLVLAFIDNIWPQLPFNGRYWCWCRNAQVLVNTGLQGGHQGPNIGQIIIINRTKILQFFSSSLFLVLIYKFFNFIN